MHRRTAAGSFSAAIAAGLRDVLDPRKEREKLVIESRAPSEPEPDEFTRVIVHIDPDDPLRSYAIIRDLPEPGEVPGAGTMAAGGEPAGRPRTGGGREPADRSEERPDSTGQGAG